MEIRRERVEVGSANSMFIRAAPRGHPNISTVSRWPARTEPANAFSGGTVAYSSDTAMVTSHAGVSGPRHFAKHSRWRIVARP